MIIKPETAGSNHKFTGIPKEKILIFMNLYELNCTFLGDMLKSITELYGFTAIQWRKRDVTRGQNGEVNYEFRNYCT